MVPSSSPRGIGTMQEKSLHAALKAWYMLPGDRSEVTVDGYMIDIVRHGLLIEIQTRNFAALKRKLSALVEHHAVRLVYPLPYEKWIVNISEDGRTLLGRRRSPKRGGLEQVFNELVSLPQLVCKQNFSLEVLLVREEETRRKTSPHRWNRRGWSPVDRQLIEVVDSITFTSPSDYGKMLPPALGPQFTSRDLSNALDRSHRLAQKMTYCLRGMGVIDVVGKQGQSLLYAPHRPMTEGAAVKA
jgi:hypothetical protein